MSTLTLTLPKPHSAQTQIIREARRFNVLACGRRWGKTTLGIDRIVHPALMGLPVGWFSPTYKMLAEVWREAVRLLRPVVRTINSQERRLELITGGVVDMWSLDTPDVARGRKYARVVIDEAAMVRGLKDAWQQVIRPTLTDYEGDAFFLSTPKGFNDFYELWAMGQEAAGDFKSWRKPTTTNPHISPAEVGKAKRELPDHVFEQEYDAIFLNAPGGRVYDVWDEANVTEEADYIPDAGPIYWAVDDGYAGEIDPKVGTFGATAHPRVFLFCQMKGDGHLDVFDEDYRVKTLDEQHLKDIMALPYPAPDFAAVDKSAASLKGRLHAHGIYTRNSPPSVEESIKETHRWLAPDENNWRRIRVHPRCYHLIKEFSLYRRDELTGRPVKAFDHGPDCIRGLTWNLRQYA